MSTPTPTFESRDTVLFCFQDTDLEEGISSPQYKEEFVRHYVSMYFAIDLKTDPDRPDLDRTLALAREREQFCRGANDFFRVGPLSGQPGADPESSRLPRGSLGTVAATGTAQPPTR